MVIARERPDRQPRTIWLKAPAIVSQPARWPSLRRDYDLSLVSFADLLRSAVTDPGILSNAYRQFHHYSLGNQLLAWLQCHERGIRAGPMATCPKWRALGRQVRKGEKALTLCQPVTVKRAPASGDDSTNADVFTRFVYRPHWFVLARPTAPTCPRQRRPHGTPIAPFPRSTLRKLPSTRWTAT